jgi:hypothetical protein
MLIYLKEEHKKKILLQASRDVRLEVSTEKTKCMVVSRHQNVGQNDNLLTANNFFENVVKMKCLRTTVTNENFIHKEIESRLVSGSASCCYCVQSPWSSRFLSKSLKTKIHKNRNFTRCFVWV